MRKVEEVLLATGKVPMMAIQSAKDELGEHNTDALWQFFVQKKRVTETEVFQAYAKVLRTEYVDLKGYDIAQDALATLSSHFCRSENIIPIDLRGETLFVGTANPGNFTAIDEISANTLYNVSVKIVSPSDLREALDRYYRADEEIEKLSEEIEQGSGASVQEEVVDSIDDVEDESPVVKFVNLLIAQAIQDRASDIHVEPGEKELVVRYRIDGVLHQMQKADKSIQKGVISRLKVMSNIDIGERRKPQDGRITRTFSGQTIDIRVVTLPITWGEKVVMRILDHSNERKSVASIGMSPHNQEIFERAIHRPHGMVLVTGPTGSGKALPLDTKIPTPTGFTTIGEISENDEIFGSNGKVYTVTSKSEIDNDAEIYEITFSDGQKVMADADHQWLVSTSAKRHIKQKKKVATETYIDSHKTLTKLAYLSLEFTPEFGSRTADEILNLLNKEDIHYYDSPSSVTQSLHMMNMYGAVGQRPTTVDSEVKVLEYPIEDALLALACRIRQQHAVIQSNDTPVVRVTTQEMLDNGLFIVKNNNGKITKRKNYAVPVPASLELPDKDLLIDPYLLGVWLGDGHSSAGAITIGSQDQEEFLKILSSTWNAAPHIIQNPNNTTIKAVFKRPLANICIYGHDSWIEVGIKRKYKYCRACGTKTRNTSRKAQSPINASLGESLAYLNLRNNKHIPEMYLRASSSQRLSVLQGLIDSDGYVGKKGSVELSFANITLTKDSLQLIRSLGIKASVRYNQNGGYKDKDGNHVPKIRHRISFTTNLDIARLPRKKERLPKTLRTTNKWNYISEIKKLDSVPAQCLSVSSPDFTFLVGDGFITTSNSTTIYTALNEVAEPTVNVVTVEDPVEKKIPGINQIQINNKAGLTFSTALRSILRADPDIVFLGEIRDEETAKIAIDASMTGHLVLSTLHTNGAPEAASRLIEMGVEPYLVGNSVTCVVAQRLARKLCEDCKKPVTIAPDVLAKIEFPFVGKQLYTQVGCKNCAHTGYRGRIALTEVMEINEEIEKLIAQQSTANVIRREAEKHGLFSLKNDGWIKVSEGLTTIEEILRISV